MNKKKRNFIISTILILLSIVFTVLVKVVDVEQIGPNQTSVGFATINKFVFDLIGENKIWYNITDLLDIIPILLVLGYAFIGFMQLIKRKSILKVDKEIIILGVFYIVVISLYVFFEKFIINYRPVLMDGVIEASYPSSHTFMTLFICGSGLIINNRLFKNKTPKAINIILLIIIPIIVIGRLISGVHWFTDIIGGIIISSALLMSFYTTLSLFKKGNK